MITVPLSPIPNQTFSVTVGDYQFDFTLKALGDSGIVMDLLRDGITIVQGLQIVPGSWLVPYPYLCDTGNFALICEDEAVPQWDLLGTKQVLYFFDVQEVADATT